MENEIGLQRDTDVDDPLPAYAFCTNCNTLNQELEKSRKQIVQTALNYSTIKQKLSSTDQLIKQYSQKCKENEDQKKQLVDLSKKLTISERDRLALHSQLENMVKCNDPTQKELDDLKIVNRNLEKRLDETATKCRASELICEQLKVVIKERETALREKELDHEELVKCNKEYISREKKNQLAMKKFQEDIVKFKHKITELRTEKRRLEKRQNNSSGNVQRSRKKERYSLAGIKRMLQSHDETGAERNRLSDIECEGTDEEVISVTGRVVDHQPLPRDAMVERLSGESDVDGADGGGWLSEDDRADQDGDAADFASLRAIIRQHSQQPPPLIAALSPSRGLDTDTDDDVDDAEDFDAMSDMAEELESQLDNLMAEKEGRSEQKSLEDSGIVSFLTPPEEDSSIQMELEQSFSADQVNDGLDNVEKSDVSMDNGKITDSSSQQERTRESGSISTQQPLKLADLQQAENREIVASNWQEETQASQSETDLQQQIPAVSESPSGKGDISKDQQQFTQAPKPETVPNHQPPLTLLKSPTEKGEITSKLQLNTQASTSSSQQFQTSKSPIADSDKEVQCEPPTLPRVTRSSIKKRLLSGHKDELVAIPMATKRQKRSPKKTDTSPAKLQAGERNDRGNTPSKDTSLVSNVAKDHLASEENEQGDSMMVEETLDITHSQDTPHPKSTKTVDLVKQENEKGGPALNTLDIKPSPKDASPDPTRIRDLDTPQAKVSDQPVIGLRERDPSKDANTVLTEAVLSSIETQENAKTESCQTSVNLSKTIISPIKARDTVCLEGKVPKLTEPSVGAASPTTTILGPEKPQAESSNDQTGENFECNKLGNSSSSETAPETVNGSPTRPKRKSYAIGQLWGQLASRQAEEPVVDRSAESGKPRNSRPPEAVDGSPTAKQKSCAIGQLWGQQEKRSVEELVVDWPAAEEPEVGQPVVQPEKTLPKKNRKKRKKKLKRKCPAPVMYQSGHTLTPGRLRSKRNLLRWLDQTFSLEPLLPPLLCPAPEATSLANDQADIAAVPSQLHSPPSDMELSICTNFSGPEEASAQLSPLEPGELVVVESTSQSLYSTVTSSASNQAQLHSPSFDPDPEPMELSICTDFTGLKEVPARLSPLEPDELSPTESPPRPVGRGQEAGTCPQRNGADLEQAGKIGGANQSQAEGSKVRKPGPTARPALKGVGLEQTGQVDSPRNKVLPTQERESRHSRLARRLRNTTITGREPESNLHDSAEILGTGRKTRLQASQACQECNHTRPEVRPKRVRQGPAGLEGSAGKMVNRCSGTDKLEEQQHGMVDKPPLGNLHGSTVEKLDDTQPLGDQPKPPGLEASEEPEVVGGPDQIGPAQPNLSQRRDQRKRPGLEASRVPEAVGGPDQIGPAQPNLSQRRDRQKRPGLEASEEPEVVGGPGLVVSRVPEVVGDPDQGGPAQPSLSRGRVAAAWGAIASTTTDDEPREKLGEASSEHWASAGRRQGTGRQKRKGAWTAAGGDEAGAAGLRRSNRIKKSGAAAAGVSLRSPARSPPAARPPPAMATSAVRGRPKSVAKKRSVPVQLEPILKRPVPVRLDSILKQLPEAETQGRCLALIEQLVQYIHGEAVDLLPVVKAKILAGNTSCKPVLSHDEERIVAAALKVTPTAVSGSFTQDLMDELYRALFTDALYVRQRSTAHSMALCRVLTALARCTGNIEYTYVMCCDILSNHSEISPLLLLTIAAVWPATLLLQGEEPAVRRPIQKAIKFITKANLLTAVSSVHYCSLDTAAFGFIHRSFQQLCGWDMASETAEALSEQLLSRLRRHPSPSPFTEETYLPPDTFQCVKAMELLARHRGWEWTNDWLLRESLWPVLRDWSKDQWAVPPSCVVAVLSLIGRVGRIGFGHDISSVAELCGKMGALLALPTIKDVQWDVQVAAGLCVIDLSPSDPCGALINLKKWQQETGVANRLPDNVLNKLNKLVQKFPNSPFNFC